MARPLIEAAHYSTFEEIAHSEGPLAGTRSRLLSRDDEDGAFSAMVKAPAGTVLRPDPARSLEVFVMSGHAELGDEELKPGFYGYVAPGEDHAITARQDSLIFYATGEQGTGSGTSVVVDPDTIPWRIRIREDITPATTEVVLDLVDGDKPPVTVNRVPGSGASVNIVKFLRSDETGGSASIGAMFPGSGLDCAESHVSVDESLSLRGDLLLFGPDGQAIESRPGSYTWRPAYARHLPKYSHHGHLSFARTREAGWRVTVEYEAEPRWPALLQTYREKLGVSDGWG